MAYQFVISIPFTVVAIVIGIVITEIVKRSNPRQWSE